MFIHITFRTQHNSLVQNKERTPKHLKQKDVEDDRWGSSMTPTIESAPDLDQLLVYVENMEDMEWIQRLSK